MNSGADLSGEPSVPLRLSGKRAIVTGGTQGIGKATVRRLLSEGAEVILTGRDRERGLEVERALNILGHAHYVQQDVAVEADWRRVIEAADKRFGGLDILVNNAAASISQKISQSTVADFNATLLTNLTSVFMGIKYGGKLMIDGQGGAIINLSSVAAGKAHSVLPAYTASKMGVEALTKCAVLEYAEGRHNIRINAIRPGYIETDLSGDFLREIGGSIEGGLEIMAKRHPVGFIGQPEDVANLIAFLSSDEARFITGSIFSIDGGYQIQ